MNTAKTDRLAILDINSCISFEKDLIISNLYEWFNTQENSPYNIHGRFFESKKQLSQYYEQLDWSINIIWSIFLSDDIHIGNISLQNINLVDRIGEFSCVFGHKYWGKGYCFEAAKVLFNHAFNNLNFYKIWLGTAATNIGMNRVAEKLGMKIEATLNKHIFLNGEYIDVNRYRIFKNEWPKING